MLKRPAFGNTQTVAGYAGRDFRCEVSDILSSSFQGRQITVYMPPLFPTHIIKDRLYVERSFLFAGFVSWEKRQPVSVAIYPDTGFTVRFYDAGLSFFHIRFWGETKFSFRGGHIFEKTFSERI